MPKLQDLNIKFSRTIGKLFEYFHEEDLQYDANFVVEIMEIGSIIYRVTHIGKRES